MPDGKDGLLAVEVGGPLGSAWGLGRAAGQVNLPAQAALFHAVLALHHHHRAARIGPGNSCNIALPSVLCILRPLRAQHIPAFPKLIISSSLILPCSPHASLLIIIAPAEQR